MKYKSHSFSTELASLIGLKEAIILFHLYFWHEQNKANGTNFYDGSYWTFNSVKAFSEQFEYLSEKEIRGALSRLNELGYTVEGNYNKLQIDKTKWYSLSESAIKMLEDGSIYTKGQMELQKGKWTAQKGEALPDVNTYTNTNKELSEKFEKFWKFYAKGSKKASREKFMKLSEKDLELIRIHLPAYFKANPEVKFRKDAERYLSNRLWENGDIEVLDKKAELPKNWWTSELTKEQWALLTPNQRMEKENNDTRRKFGI